MRAALIREFGPVEDLTVETMADPVVSPGHVVVDVHATAVNFVDLLVITGKYQFLPPRPFTPGKLPCGVVIAVGPDVTTLRVGDRVMTLHEQGGYAEKVLVPAHECYVLPDSLSFVDAAAMSLAYDTAWFALCERGRAKPGESVLVLGATGGVGLAAIQLARAYGLHVLAAVSSPGKTQQVRDAGAHGIVDLSQGTLIDSLREQVRAQTDGQGVDIVIDTLGGDVFDAALRGMAWRGRLVVVGFATGRIPTLKVNYVMLKNIEVSGLQVSDYRKRTPDDMAHCIREIFRLYEDGALRPAAVTQHPLEDVVLALDALQSRRASGRLVLTMNADASAAPLSTRPGA